MISKKSIDDFDFIAKRPKNTSLDNKTALKILKTKILSIDEGLQKLKDVLFKQPLKGLIRPCKAL